MTDYGTLKNQCESASYLLCTLDVFNIFPIQPKEGGWCKVWKFYTLINSTATVL